MLILSTVSEGAIQHAQGTTTSRELWLALERAFAPHTSSREYTLKTQLLRIEMKPDESSFAYLTRAQEYATALANIGEPMKEKDLVMLIISGLRTEYNGLKTAALTKQLALNELHALFADHDYMHQKNDNIVPPTQAFTAALKPPPVSGSVQSVQPSDAAVQAVQQLAAQLGLQLQIPSQPQAFYTNRSSNNRNNRSNNNRGRGGFSQQTNRNNGGNKNQFSWATNQNTVYGSCNRCGIGHIPSLCPNRDPTTIRPRQQPSANYADYRSQESSTWLSDTGSSHHVAPDLSGFDNYETYYGSDSLHVGNGKGLPILHIGSKNLHSPNRTFHLRNILHVPQIKQNLLSVQKFCYDNHVYFEFHASFFCVKDEATHTTLLTGPSTDGLYSFNIPRFQTIPKVAFSAVRASNIWHQRLGHPHPQLLKSMLSTFHLPLNDNCSSSFCDSCSIGKSSKQHLLNSNFKSSHVLDLVFCDVWGPSAVTSVEGHNYFLLCVDHYSKFMWFFPFKLKSDVFTILKQFIVMAERQFGTKLKQVQTDWGGEFRNLSNLFRSLGVIHRLSCPHTSEQNGTVERRHRHVVETGLTLLAHSHVPYRFWNYAFDTAVYLINRMPSRNNSSVSPFQHLFKRSPDYSFLRVFGSQCFPHLRPYNKHKIEFRSTPCVFLGYSPDHHGYRCLDTQTDRLYIARHVRFNELCFPFGRPTRPTTTPTEPEPEPYISTYPDPYTPDESSPPDDPHATPSSPNPTPSTPIPTPPPPPPPPIFQTYQRRPKPPNTTTTFPDQPSTAPQPTASSHTNQPAQTQAPRQRPPNLRPNPKPTTPFNVYL
ncbi:putative RNA-directed DNA polymerase [Helianthus anomalus]